jgi:hypothetical protein
MKNFTKRNQIIFLNVIFMLFWMYGMYDDYKTTGGWAWENIDDIEKSENFGVFIILTIIFVSCGISILYQILNEFPRSILQRKPLLRICLKLASLFFACSSLLIGGILAITIINRVSKNLIFEWDDFRSSIISILFCYLAYLILSQFLFSRKNRLVSEHILDEEIE